MTHTFRHPKFFKELRKRNKRAQAISEQASTEVDERSTEPGQSQSARERSSSQASSGARINKRWI